jgi:hypothetical protein
MRKMPGIFTGSGNGGGTGSTGKAAPLRSGELVEAEEAEEAAVDDKAGFCSDGYRDKPPAEMVGKLSRLSVA